MKFKIYGLGKPLKVAFFNRETFGDTLTEDMNVSEISDFNDSEIHLFSTDNKNFSVFGSYEKHLDLEKKDDVREVYSFIFDYVREHEIKICIFFGSGYPWHKSFLESLKKHSYIASYFGDDPEGANKTSRYYVKNFLYAFCGGVYFDEERRIEDVYIEWGARMSKFVPLGVNPMKYKEPNNGQDARGIDLVYVGGCYFPKVLRMFYLKKHFGDRMVMYGRGWNESNGFLKTFALKFLKFFFSIPQIEELPKDKLVNLYQNTKIGFNIHMSYGPSNLRMYELPMNGVMQLCDCSAGLSELYDIDKEVVSYTGVLDAINKIEYYLSHDEERKSVALAGYEKAKNNYRIGTSFKKIFEEISLDIKENFSDIYGK